MAGLRSAKGFGQRLLHVQFISQTLLSLKPLRILLSQIYDSFENAFFLSCMKLTGEARDRQVTRSMSMSQSCRWLASFAFTPLLTFLCASNALAQPWTLVVVPDIQHYVDQSANVDDLNTQMQWIADNIYPYNIRFVTQIGDIVQHGDEPIEWERAENGIDKIHGLVPYSVSIGDHDYDLQEVRASGWAEYVARFGPLRYAGMSWYRGSSPDQKSHYQKFTAGGREFLHITLEWEAPGSLSDPTSPMGWAKSILDANPSTPTIISTHSYIWDRPGQEGRTNGIEEDGGNGSSGEMMWSDLIRSSPQVFMVVNGNFHAGSGQYSSTNPSGTSNDGEFHQVSYNLYGLPVYEMLSNYQDYPNGGDGWIRLLTFQPGGGENGLDRISVSTYSTTKNAYQIDARSEFFFDLNFEDRFGQIPAPMSLQRKTFTTGHDTYIWGDTPGSNYGTSTRIKVDSSNNNDPIQSLLRFDISGIPADAEIVSADLRVSITDSGNGFRLHRMQVPWSEGSVTWNSLGTGVSTSNGEAMSTPDHATFSFITKGESPGYSLFDVTESVQAWHAGSANYGWVFMPRGSDLLSIESFESTSRPPVLVVDYILPNTTSVTVTTGQDAYIWENQPSTNFGAATRTILDANDGGTWPTDPQPMQGLIRFAVSFGTNAGQIPTGAQITRAELQLQITDSGDGFALHRLKRNWSQSTVTWSSLTDGVQVDGTDAVPAADLITADYLPEQGASEYTSFDVTASVQAWANGTTNYGWALIPLGADKLYIQTFEATAKPRLIIDYTTPQ